MSEVRCPSCRIPVEPIPPKTKWKIACAVFWICAMVTSTVFSLLLGLNVILVPLWFGIGAAVGVAAERASCWTCPVCGDQVAAPEEVREAEGRALVPRTV